MNLVILSGNTGHQPEIKYSQSGLAIANLSLVTQEKVKDEKKTVWHKIVAFGKTAELIYEYVNKGDRITIQGRITYEEWEKEGVKRTATKIIADKVEFGGSKKRANENEAVGMVQDVFDSKDEDIPF